MYGNKRLKWYISGCPHPLKIFAIFGTCNPASLFVTRWRLFILLRESALILIQTLQYHITGIAGGFLLGHPFLRFDEFQGSRVISRPKRICHIKTWRGYHYGYRSWTTSLSPHLKPPISVCDPARLFSLRFGIGFFLAKDF